MSFHNSCVWLNKNTCCVKVDKQEFVWEYFLSLMSYSDENKSGTRVDESWQARVCMRVFSTLKSWSNENKSCMRVNERWQARVLYHATLRFNHETWENVIQSLTCKLSSTFTQLLSPFDQDMRVEKTLIQTLASQLSCNSCSCLTKTWETLKHMQVISLNKNLIQHQYNCSLAHSFQ